MIIIKYQENWVYYEIRSIITFMTPLKGDAPFISFFFIKLIYVFFNDSASTQTA